MVGRNYEHLSLDEIQRRVCGERAEEVAHWYFRLNGFLMIPGFIVHPDVQSEMPRTEADLIGIRLKNSAEAFWVKQPRQTFRTNEFRSPKPMKDDAVFINAGKVGSASRHVVALVEVKAGMCAINGPWSNSAGLGDRNSSSNMERALARIGFCENRSVLYSAAKAMYDELRYEGTEYVVQYFAVGRVKNQEIQDKYPRLIQISFEDIATFLHERFTRFPQKLPLNTEITLWKGFGDEFRDWFQSHSNNDEGPGVSECQRAVIRFIQHGRCAN